MKEISNLHFYSTANTSCNSGVVQIIILFSYSYLIYSQKTLLTDLPFSST